MPDKIFSISTYTFLIDLGVLATLAWLWWRAAEYQRSGTRWLDAGLSGLVGGLAGGRLAFALNNWAYFQNHFGELFRFWEGGYEWYGATLGAILCVVLYCYWKKESFWEILEELALPSLVLFALHWLGCAASACASGLAVPPGVLPFALNLPDLYGVILPRWPAQYIGFAFTMIALVYLVTQREKSFPRGFRFALAFTLMAVIAFSITLIRGDDMPKVGTIRLDTLMNGLMILVGVAGLGAAWFLTPTKNLTAEKIN